MRQVCADFARLAERQDLGLSVPLGRADRSPELAELRDGEGVLLVEPGELYAQAIVRPVEANGCRWWYGVIESREAIHDLEPDQAAPAQA